MSKAVTCLASQDPAAQLDWSRTAPTPPPQPHLLLVRELDQPLCVPALLAHAPLQHRSGVHILKHVGCVAAAH